MPELHRLMIGDDPQGWRAAGFTVTGGETTIGNIAVRFIPADADLPADADVPADVAVDAGPGEGRAGGVIGWEFSGLTDASRFAAENGQIDGIRTIVATEDPASFETAAAHQNRVTRMDHVVVMTPDIGRTVSALEAAGFSPSRTRDIPNAEPPRRQVFLWAGETILEVVGPMTASGDGPATIWGLALTTDDMDAAVADLGTAISTPKEAVQPGRRIATIRTKELGISIALALMTPHVSVGNASDADRGDA